MHSLPAYKSQDCMYYTTDKRKKQPEKTNFRLFFTFWSANSESKDFPAKKSIPMKAPLHT
ncbi:MAG: hypothetical protein DBY04_06950 [Clostridiales bacterium]|nr:MAG: hypothetical protein DBY04_06950 [Clostridiales bacterium]